MKLKARPISSNSPSLPTARLLSYPEYAPVRKLVTGHRGLPTGIFPSVKNGGPVEYESSGERFGIYIAEVNVQVQRYFAQPFRLEWIERGKVQSYTPDRLDMTESGLVVVEMKYSTEKPLKPDYAQKLETAARILQGAGMTFRLDTAEALKRSAEFECVEDILRCNHVTPSLVQQIEISEFLHKRPAATLGEVSERLGAEGAGRQFACALVPRRILSIDLARPLFAGSPVTIAEEGLKLVS